MSKLDILNTSDRFSKFLRKVRTDAKLTVRQAADRCQISYSHWSNLENSKRKPTAEVVNGIVKGLQLPVNQAAKLRQAVDMPEQALQFLAPKDIEDIGQLHLDPSMAQSIEDDLHDFRDCWRAYVRAKYEQYNRNWEQTIEIADEALQNLQRLNKRTSAYLLDTKAAAQLHLNQQEAVTETYQQLDETLKGLSDPFIRAYNKLHHGDYSREYNQWSDAEKYYREAHGLFASMQGYDNEVARCDRKLASMYLHQGDWRRAESTLGLCLKTFEARGNLYEQIKTHFVLGWAYNLNGQWAQAQAEHQRGFDLAHEQHQMRDNRSDPYLIMLAHSYLATDARQQRDWDTAEVHYAAAKDRSLELGYKREDSWIELGRARLHHQRGRMYEFNNYADEADQDFEQAAKHFRDSEQYSKNTGSHYQYAMTLVHHARFLLDRGRYQEAKSKLLEAKRLTTDLGSAYYYEATTKTLLCEIYRRSGDIDDIAQFANRITKLHDQFTFHNHMAALRMTEARVSLATHSSANSSAVEHAATNIARAILHALRFNDFYVDELLATFGRMLSFHGQHPYPHPIQEQLRKDVAKKLDDILIQSRAAPHVLEDWQKDVSTESYIESYEQEFAGKLAERIEVIRRCPIDGAPYLPPNLRLDIDGVPTR